MSDPMTNLGPFDVEIEPRSVAGADAVVVTPNGEVDLASADDLAAALRRPECASADGVVLDLSQVGFMDSSGLRVVLMLAEERGDRLTTVLAADSAVMRLFELVDVIDRVHPASSLDEALAAIGAASHAD
jgi:anti-anti-sigma factor